MNQSDADPCKNLEVLLTQVAMEDQGALAYFKNELFAGTTELKFSSDSTFLAFYGPKKVFIVDLNKITENWKSEKNRESIDDYQMASDANLKSQQSLPKIQLFVHEIDSQKYEKILDLQIERR